jgi:hypothetical protein
MRIYDFYFGCVVMRFKGAVAKGMNSGAAVALRFVPHHQRIKKADPSKHPDKSVSRVQDFRGLAGQLTF